MSRPVEIIRHDIREALAEHPDGMLEALAERFEVSLGVVLACLPAENARAVCGEHFVAVLEDIAEWGDVTFITHNADAVIEVSGPLPKGRMGHGMYNLQQGESRLGGHLRPERCAAIWFVERPFMGVSTMSVQFINLDGGAMFKIYVGRDAERNLWADQVARFERLKHHYPDLPA